MAISAQSFAGLTRNLYPLPGRVLATCYIGIQGVPLSASLAITDRNGRVWCDTLTNFLKQVDLK